MDDGINMGLLIGILSGMLPEVDPSVIESYVNAWLTAHPEATTTVQDGSITLAKLASDLAAKINSISSLSDEIDRVEKTSATPVYSTTDGALVEDAANRSCVFTVYGSSDGVGKLNSDTGKYEIKVSAHGRNMINMTEITKDQPSVVYNKRVISDKFIVGHTYKFKADGQITTTAGQWIYINDTGNATFVAASHIKSANGNPRNEFTFTATATTLYLTSSSKDNYPTLGNVIICDTEIPDFDVWQEYFSSDDTIILDEQLSQSEQATSVNVETKSGIINYFWNDCGAEMDIAYISETDKYIQKNYIHLPTDASGNPTYGQNNQVLKTTGTNAFWGDALSAQQMADAISAWMSEHSDQISAASTNFVTPQMFKSTAGTGTENDTTAVQSAINYAIETGYSLFFPAGVYAIQPITIANAKGLRIKGDSPASYFASGSVVTRGSIITNYDKTSDSIIFTLNNCHSCSVENIIFDSQILGGSVGVGLEIKSCHSITITDVSTMRWDVGTVIANSWSIYFTNLHSTYNAGWGVMVGDSAITDASLVQGTLCQDISFINGRIENNGLKNGTGTTGGMMVAGDSVRIFGVDLEGQDIGITTSINYRNVSQNRNCRGWVVEGCYFEGMRVSAFIVFQNVFNSVYIGNRVSVNSSAAGNHIISSIASGGNVYQLDNCKLSKNTSDALFAPDTVLVGEAVTQGNSALTSEMRTSVVTCKNLAELSNPA